MSFSFCGYSTKAQLLIGQVVVSMAHSISASITKFGRSYAISYKGDQIVSDYTDKCNSAIFKAMLTAANTSEEITFSDKELHIIYTELFRTFAHTAEIYEIRKFCPMVFLSNYRLHEHYHKFDKTYDNVEFINALKLNNANDCVNSYINLSNIIRELNTALVLTGTINHMFSVDGIAMLDAIHILREKVNLLLADAAIMAGGQHLQEYVKTRMVERFVASGSFDTPAILHLLEPDLSRPARYFTANHNKYYAEIEESVAKYGHKLV